MHNKVAKTLGFKALGDGKDVSAGQLAKINKLANVPLKAEQVYVRRYLMAHNGIDRDNERFSEDLLEEFSKTLTGKGFFVKGHPSSWNGDGGPGEGRYFDSSTQEMTPAEFKKQTGEKINLPKGVKTVKVLWGDSYLLKLDSNTDMLAKIDAGIYPFTSIGFNAPYKYVKDKNDQFLYGEYRAGGEALEGSLVWLGAQPGAGAMKSKTKTESDKKQKERKDGGEMELNDFFNSLNKVLGINKTITEKTVLEEIETFKTAKEDKIKELEEENGGLKQKAADGDSYRKSLVDDAIRFGAMIKEYSDKEDEQKKEAEFLATWPIERLKSHRDKYEKRAREQFPTDSTFKSKDETDRQTSAAAGKVKTDTGKKGKKDLTIPANNELFNTLAK